jgi:hypothetical protein
LPINRDQEGRDKQRISEKVNVLHQGALVGHQTVETKSSEKGAQQRFDTHDFGHHCR